MTTLLLSGTEEPMPNIEDHFRVVYVNIKTETTIVSMPHVSREKACSMVEMLNKYTALGHFRVEDEWDSLSEQVRAA